MATASTCPECGGPLVPGALGNRCPRCLMRIGLSETDQANDLPLVTSPESRRFGDYELLEEVGRGGMGVVYRARQISLNRVVAIKMLLARPFAVPELEERLHLEAEAAAGLNHPNIVTIYDFGECNDQFYFSMEYVEGRNLAQLTRHQSLAPTQAARYLKTVAQAVHHAHEHGILHRDLKPSNILIDLHDQVKVTDFGLAKRLGTDSELTLTGQLVGSPNYLSPEQAAGNHRSLTVRSDVYSLGAVLYQLLTARPPLVGKSMQETLVQIREREAPSPRLLSIGIPRDLETICLKCLEKEPARRYDSAQALAADLGRFLERKPIEARPVSAAGRAWRWCRRNPALAGALGACALALFMGVLGIAWQSQRAITEARVARRNLYGADMLLTQQALEQSDLGRAKELLDQYRPGGKAETDLRGWEWRYLWSQCQSDEKATLFRGSNAVTALAFSADGSQLAMRRDPGNVMFWDTQSRRMTSEHPASARFKALTASPTNHLFAWSTRESNGTPSVLLWDFTLHREVARLPHTNDVVSLAFSRDAQFLATLTRDTEVLVWDVASRTNAARVQIQTNFSLGEGDEYGCVLFSPTGRLLAVGTKEWGTQPYLHLVDWGTGAVTNIYLSKPADGVSAMAFTPDGKWLALGGGYLDNSIHLYELETGALSRLEGHRGWLAGLAFRPDGQVLAAASADQTIGLWDVRRGALISRFRGHADEVNAVAWTLDGGQLVSGSKDGTVRYWDPAARLHKSAYAVPPEQTRDQAFAPDSKTLFTTSWAQGTVVIRDARTFQELSSLPFLGSGWGRLALGGDGHWLALAGLTGNVELWDLKFRRQITRFAIGNRSPAHLEFSHAGDRLLCIGEHAGGKRILQLYDVASQRPITLEGIALGGLYEAILSPSGGTLAVAHRGGTVTWWDLKTRQRQALFDWQQLGEDFSMAFSPDERWFAAGGSTSALMLVGVGSQQTRQIARVHPNQVNGLAFSPDGRRLITSGTAGNDTLKIWDVESGRDIASLGGKPGFYEQIGFSPDGNTLFAAGWLTIFFWRAPSFEEISAWEKTRAHPADEREDFLQRFSKDPLGGR
jgi:eukaryotic-like serine/threonine-protein kinase